jgi:esterase/lipase
MKCCRRAASGNPVLEEGKVRRRIIAAAITLLAAAAILLATGPRVEIDTTIRFDERAIGDDPQAWLAAGESRFGDIRAGLGKEIVWADPGTRAKTPLALVYLHGFTASKGEVRPLPDLVASALGANLYYARLVGHGRSPEAMAEATVNGWINDLAEALAIGRRIGERVIVMATSTGGTIAAWGAAQPGLMRDVAGLILISPNFEIRASGMNLLLLPWGETLARLVVGKERVNEPDSELERHLWTWRHPVEALLPLAAMVKLAREADYSRTTIPALFVFSDRDQVVNPQATRRIAANWVAPHRLLPVEDATDPSMHVLAGDARSPATTERLAREVTEWIRQLPAP